MRGDDLMAESAHREWPSDDLGAVQGVAGAPLLSVEDLRVHYRDGWAWKSKVFSAVDGVNLVVNAGETLGIVGESGCGKSTMLRAILRLVPIHTGRIFWKGQRIDLLSESAMRPLRQQLQMIFQDPFSSLNPRMTVGQIVAEPLHNFGRYPRADRQMRVMDVLHRVGMNPRLLNRYPHEFSGGQRQRIGIARALIVQPELICCDEPVSALDVSIQAQIINLLQDLQQEFGLAFLFISHDLAVVRHLAHRIGVMYQGKIVEIAPAENLYRTPMHPYTQMLLKSIPVPDPSISLSVAPEAWSVQTQATDKGCPFSPRCPFVQERCRNEVPSLEGTEHQVACFNARQI